MAEEPILIEEAMLRERCDELVNRAEAGEKFSIVRDGEIVALLVPCKEEG